MEKEFVPYEQALALKELGFESPYPIGGYQGGKVFYYENGELYYDGRPMYSSDSHSGQILAPLYQQAFRWFREKYDLHCNIDPWGYCIFDDNGTEKTGFETYEQSQLECIEELIKIVK